MDMLAGIQEQLKELFPGVLDIQFLEAAPEIIKASIIVRPDLCKAGAILHGGAIMAFADTLGAVATLLNLPSGKWTTTIESKTNFLGAAKVGSVVIGECTPLHRGSRTMVWQTKVMTEAGKVVAYVTQTQMVME